MLFTLYATALLTTAACKREKEAAPVGTLQLQSIAVGTTPLNLQDASQNQSTPADRAFVFQFSDKMDTLAVRKGITLVRTGGNALPLEYRFLNDYSSVSISRPGGEVLDNNTSYTFLLAGSIKGFYKQTFGGANVSFKTARQTLVLDSVRIGNRRLLGSNRIIDVELQPAILVYFNKPVKREAFSSALVSVSGQGASQTTTELDADGKRLTIRLQSSLRSYERYTLNISATLQGTRGEEFAGLAQPFYTQLDSTDKFPRISDDALLNLVQERTLKYFTDFAHPVSGLARERDQSGDMVTVGGSGFGVMGMVAGVERGFLTRTDAVGRWDKITRFLKKADRFHGIWPHWMNGNTGTVMNFSPNDDGADLVESSFMFQGLITVREYLKRNPGNITETGVINRIDSLWREAEWSWFRRGGQNVLYWHWSPRVEWAMNHQLRGWNETLITYVMAGSSPTFPVPKVVYDQGYCSGGDYRNGRSFYGVQLPLGPDQGGPLFFTHYSFLGLDPRNLRDANAQYLTQNQAHAQINYRYCVANPRQYVGYSRDCWGLTASDNHAGYSAHEPRNDLGVITPTAAVASLPYTPEESMRAIRHFYYQLGDRTWGPYGFYDAFNQTEGWYGRTYLAIDQGPIVVMIENHRSGLLWNLFMNAPEIRQGLTSLGFTY